MYALLESPVPVTPGQLRMAAGILLLLKNRHVPLSMELPHFLPGYQEENWVDVDSFVDRHFLHPSN